MSLVFSPVAYRDLHRLHAFICREHPRSARVAVDRIKHTCQLLLKHPHAGYIVNPERDIRELLIPFGKGNFIVHYQTTSKSIHIAHIWHSKEDRSTLWG